MGLCLVEIMEAALGQSCRHRWGFSLKMVKVWPVAYKKQSFVLCIYTLLFPRPVGPKYERKAESPQKTMVLYILQRCWGRCCACCKHNSGSFVSVRKSMEKSCRRRRSPSGRLGLKDGHIKDRKVTSLEKEETEARGMDRSVIRSVPRRVIKISARRLLWSHLQKVEWNLDKV